MEIKLIYFRVLIVVLIILDFSLANNEQKRRRPPIESQHDVYATLDSDGNYLDQIASDSYQYNSQNVIVPPPSSDDSYYAEAETFRGEEPNYPKEKPIKKTLKASMSTGKPAEAKVHYITPQPYSPEEYVQSAMDLGHQQFTYSREPMTTRENYPAHSFFEKTTTTIEKKPERPIKKATKVKAYQEESEDYHYYFPESKKIIAKTTKNPDETYYKPQSPGAVIKKEKKTGPDDGVNNYHYYYPAIEDTPTYDESFPDTEPQKILQKYQPYIPSTPTTSDMPANIEKPVKFSSKKKAIEPIENSSTDSYQYQPVLQRPNQYDSSMEDFSLHHEQQFYPAFPQHYQEKSFNVHSTSTPTATIKMLKPSNKLVKDSHFSQFSASMPIVQASPSPPSVRSTANPRMRIKRPTTTVDYEEPKSYSPSPSPTPVVYHQTTRFPDVINFSTTRSPSASFNFSSLRLPINLSTDRSPAPIIYSTPRSPMNLSTTRSPALVNYSTTKSPVSYYSINHDTPSSVKYSTSATNIVHEPKVYINPSPQITPSVTPSFVDLDTDTSDINTVHIRPKVRFQQYQPSSKETIIYKIVEPASKRNLSTTDFPRYRTTKPTVSVSIVAPDYYKNLNQTTQDDVEFNNNFNKNYNYQYFTEQDASTFDGEQMKDFNQQRYNDNDGEEEMEDDKQVASKKNMYYSADSNEFINENPITNDYAQNLEEREMPPPVGLSNAELEPESSKPHQYYVVYDVENDKREERKKKKQHREPEHVTQYHHHDYETDHEEPKQYYSYQNDPYAGFDSELLNSENVRIVDPAVRGGRPIEFSKDDYMRHIKQAVVQYMKDVHPTKDNVGSGSSTKLKNQRYHEISEVPHRPTKTPAASSTPTSYRNKLPSEQYKQFSSPKLPKGVYHGGRPLKEAIDELQDLSQVHNIDLTNNKSKMKPFDLSAIDVGQSYQHVTHFDHSAALKNTEEFDQTHAVSNQQPQRQKLHFNQQSYQDINEMIYNKPKQQDDDVSQNLFKGYVLPNKYSGTRTRESSLANNLNFESSKLPRITHNHDDDDEDDNKLEHDEHIDAPIQIINGIPVANPYNIDLNTLKYMLGGIAQAEVNDQLKDLDEQPNSNQRYPPSSWKSFSAHSNPLIGSYTANAPVYQVYGNQENTDNEKVREISPKPKKKNSGNNGSKKNQQNKFPLVGTLMNYNKNKANSNNNNNNNKHRNSNGNNNGHKSNQNVGFNDNNNFNGWNQMNKKQRSGQQQAASSNQQTKSVHPSGANYMVLRPVKKNNKQVRDEKINNNVQSSNSRIQHKLTELRPPPHMKNHLRVTKVI